MTKLTRKLLLSIITVVLTVVALGTTTFAWFTLTNTATINEFDAEIIADSGIEIAIGAIGTPTLSSLEWKTIITPADIYEYFGGTDVDALQLLNHVTTEDALTFYTLGTTVKSGTVTSGYIDIPIHFRSDSADAITWTEGSVSGVLTDWTVDVAFTDAKGTGRGVGSVMQVNPADAIRMAVVGSDALGDPLVTAYENPSSTSNAVLSTGGNFGTNVYTTSGTGTPADDSDLATTPSAYANGSYDYFFKKNSSEVPLWGIEDVVVVPTITVIGGETVTVLDGAHGTDLTQTYYGNISIRIWLEGWDANSFDAQLAKAIKVSFKFFGITL